MAIEDHIENLKTEMIRATILFGVKLYDLRAYHQKGRSRDAARVARELIELVGTEQAEDWGLIRTRRKN